MSTFRDAVSVVMAVRNEELYLNEALTSILAQVGCEIEVLVIDDHSDDKTLEIALSARAADARVKVHRNPGRGKVAAFNCGVSRATGDFICLFAGDDVMPLGSLQQRLKAVSGQPSTAPVVGLCKLICWSTDRRYDGQVIPRRRGVGALSGVSPLMNRVAAARIFPVPPNLPNEDTWMELAISYLPGWISVHSDIIGAKWRVHAGNSINMWVPFADYNVKYSARMEALTLFLAQHRQELDDFAIQRLEARVRCEQHRRSGNMIGVLSSGVSIIDKLRAISCANPLMYGLRRRFYALFSGY